MKLIDDAKKAWRMFSMWAMGSAAVLQGTWEAISDEIKKDWNPKWVHLVTVVLLVLGMVGRLVQQTPKDKP